MARTTVPVDEVIAEACTVIKGVTEQEKAFMRQWAFTALRKIGFSKINMQVSDKLYLDDYSVAKPDNLVKTIDIALYQSDGREIVTMFKGYGSRQQSTTLPAPTWVTATAYVSGDRVTKDSVTYYCEEDHTSGTFSTDLASGLWKVNEAIHGRIHQDIRGISSAIHITESENYFNIEEFSNSDGSSPDGSYLIVKYYGLMVDENGLPKVPEYATLAVIMYIRWMWALRKNDNRSEIDQNWRMWKVERASAEGKAKTPDMVEGKAIAKTLNSMIQKVEVETRMF